MKRCSIAIAVLLALTGTAQAWDTYSNYDLFFGGYQEDTTGAFNLDISCDVTLGRTEFIIGSGPYDLVEEERPVGPVTFTVDGTAFTTDAFAFTDGDLWLISTTIVPGDPLLSTFETLLNEGGGDLVVDFLGYSARFSMTGASAVFPYMDENC